MTAHEIYYKKLKRLSWIKCWLLYQETN